MVFLVAAAFWGTSLAYLLYTFLSRFFTKSKHQNRFGKNMSLIARIFGILLIAFTIYFMIYNSLLFAALFIAIVIKGVNLWLARHKDRERLTHTYDEIAEKSADSKRKSWVVKGGIFVSMFFMLLYLTWRIFFTVPYRYGILSLVASILLLAVEILGAIDSFVHYKNMYNMEEYPLPEIPEDKFPHVDVFVSTYTESTELLRKTLLACMRMDYPDKEKVHIYLCDDGRREEMHVLADELGVNYLIRDTHEGAKAENLNYALANSSSPYVVTFDADMQPRAAS